MAENCNWTSQGSLRTAENKNQNRIEATKDDEDIEQQPNRRITRKQRAASREPILRDRNMKGLGGWHPLHSSCDDTRLNNEDDDTGSFNSKDCHFIFSFTANRQTPSSN